MTSMQKRYFNYSADNFRAISIIFVILSHLASLSFFDNYITFFLRDATTWFLFISGYLFFQIESKDNFSYLKYLQKKMKLVITPYLIISIPCILVGIYFYQPQNYDISTEKYIVWSLLVGGLVNFPMWFIPMIALFFLISPVFFKITKQSTLLITIIAMMGVAISIFSSRPAGNANLIYALINFFGFYLFGIFFFKIRNLIKSFSNIVAVTIIVAGVLLFAVVTFFYSNFNPNENEYIPFFEAIGLLNPVVLGKFFLLISISVFLERYYNIHNRYLRYISSISFGLFFLHGIFILIFWKYIGIRSQNSIFAICIEFVFVFLLSIVVIEISKKILKSGTRYVIGC